MEFNPNQQLPVEVDGTCSTEESEPQSGMEDDFVDELDWISPMQVNYGNTVVLTNHYTQSLVSTSEGSKPMVLTTVCLPVSWNIMGLPESSDVEDAESENARTRINLSENTNFKLQRLTILSDPSNDELNEIKSTSTESPNNILRVLEVQQLPTNGVHSDSATFQITCAPLNSENFDKNNTNASAAKEKVIPVQNVVLPTPKVKKAFLIPVATAIAEPHEIHEPNALESLEKSVLPSKIQVNIKQSNIKEIYLQKLKKKSIIFQPSEVNVLEFSPNVQENGSQIYVEETFGKLNNHLREKHKKDPIWPCTICGKKYVKRYLRIHKRKVHATEKPFACSNCSCSFITLQRLQAHEYTHLDKSPFQCTVCSKSLTTRSALNYHSLMHKTPTFRCEICNRYFINQLLLDKHVIDSQSQCRKKDFLCNVCDQRFYRNVSLQRHMFMHTGKKPFECQECSQSFFTAYDLKVHSNKHNGIRPFACLQCPKSFFENKDFRIHMRSHTGERPYTCDTCGKAFTNSTALKKHLSVHTDLRPYSCKVCLLTFRHLSALRKHETLKHKNIDREGKSKIEAMCEECGQCFSQATSLKLHQMIHTDTKPFECQDCKKTFRRKGEVKRHWLRIHSDDPSKKPRTVRKPVNCQKCGKRFSCSGPLKYHMRVHNNEKPFSCDVCEKSFRQLSGLTRHSLTVHSKSLSTE